MKIHLTPGAQQQLSIITHIDTIESGFLLGIEIGKHIIVEELFPVNFQKDNIDAVYRLLLDKKGEKLLGPFFKGAVPPADEGSGGGISNQIYPKVNLLIERPGRSGTASPASFFLSDWFIGDIIMEIGDKKTEIYLYEGEI